MRPADWSINCKRQKIKEVLTEVLGARSNDHHGAQEGDTEGSGLKQFTPKDRQDLSLNDGSSRTSWMSTTKNRVDVSENVRQSFNTIPCCDRC